MEKSCKNCYWNVKCNNGAFCMLRNKRMFEETEACKLFSHRCYVCHKKLNKNARFREIDGKEERVCEHCLCGLLAKDLVSLEQEFDTYKSKHEKDTTGEYWEGY